jgi:hypothetical protein
LVASVVLIALPAGSAAASPSTTSFRASGGKTYCLVSKTGIRARCDVKQRSFTVPPKPSSCIDHSWGIGAFVASSGSGQYVCTGQPLWLNPSPGQILPVGKSVKLGATQCASLKSGVRCVTVVGTGSRSRSRR